MRRVHFVALLLGLVLPTTAARADIVFDSPVSPGWFVGTGQTNTNFVVDTNEELGIQTGLRAEERFIGDLPNIGADYFAQPGESTAGGVPGTTDPGIATWNFDFHIDLGTNAISDVQVLLEIDFKPAAGNADVFLLDLTPFFAGSLLQDSQNLGFGFWQTIGDPNIVPFDPFAAGEYEFGLTVLEVDGEGVLSSVGMTVNVVPVPGAALLGVVGMGMVGWVRRRIA